MLKERVLSAIVLIALVLCALFLFTPFYFALALGFVATLGIWEWAQFARFKNPLARLCIAAFLGAFIFLWLYNEGNYLDAGRVFENYLPLLLLNSVGWWALALVLVVTYPSSAKVWGKNIPLQLLFAFSTLIPFVAAVLRLRLDNYTADPHHGLFLLLYVFVLVWAADSGAYFAGRAFGKHKLAPKVSPGKTWQGVFGGMITAAVLAFVFIHFSGETLLGSRAMSGFVVLSVATVAISVLGDLAESMFKRESGIKDSSQLIPGHGGILDRIDSFNSRSPILHILLFLCVIGSNMSFLWSLGSFIVAIAVSGCRARVRPLLGCEKVRIKVHRFSIGFGKVIWRRTDKLGTEFAISAIPLGGYVKNA